jgi:hypothetical protein
MNGAEAFRSRAKPTFGVVIDRFERTKGWSSYLPNVPGEVKDDGTRVQHSSGIQSSYINRHIRPSGTRYP